MSKIIKPIPTRYKGIMYKSRLEARWAVFFYTLGVYAKYEPFTIEEEGIQYTPDFVPMFGSVRTLHSLKDLVPFDLPPTTNTLTQVPLLIEIKPKTPNASYIEYLKKFTKSGKYDILVCVGNPSFVPFKVGRKEEIIIYKGLLISSDKVEYGIHFYQCEKCRAIDIIGISENPNFLHDDLIEYIIAFRLVDHYHVHNHSCLGILGEQKEAAEKANFYRFDLEKDEGEDNRFAGGWGYEV